MMSPSGTRNVLTFESLPTTSQRRGAIVVAVFASLSSLALAFIALRVIRFVAVALLRRDDNTFRPPEILFFRTQLGHYGGCLVLSNLFISLAGLLGFDLASHSGSSQGTVCSAQAALMQIGIWGTCYFTTALGVHTLGSFVFHLRPARWRSLIAVTIGWTIALVAGLVPLQKGGVYGLTGPSCSIIPSYPMDIFALEALPIILAAFASAVVYSVIFLVLHGKLSMIGIRKPRGHNLGGREEEEYHGFISMIIWTMFWFPLAFVLLLLPLCVTRIVIYAGHSIPYTSGVFADVCASILGLVHVCLLYNTFRLINPVYRGSRSDTFATETVMTFGNDASEESPIVTPTKFSPPSMVWSHESGLQRNSTQSRSSHSRDSSWASVDSNTELLCTKKATRESAQMKVVSPLRLSRRVRGDTPICSSAVVPPPRVVLPVERDGRPKAPTFKSKAPPPLNLSHPPGLKPFSPLKVTNKSSTLAMRLGIPALPAGSTSRSSVARAAQKLEQKGFASSSTSIPQIEVNAWSSEDVHVLDFRPSLPTPPSYSDLECSGEIMYAREVRSLPRIPEASDDEHDVVEACPPSPRTRFTQSRRTTMTTIWSQETGYTLSQPNATTLQLYPQPVANLVVVPWRGAWR